MSGPRAQAAERWTIPAFLLAAVVTVALLVGHLLEAPATDNQAMVVRVVDSASRRVDAVDARVRAADVHVDTIVRILEAAPGPQAAIAQQQASAALSRALLAEQDAARLRQQYDSALKVKDSVIAEQGKAIADAKAVAARMTRLHAEALADLASARASLNVVAIAPKVKQGCGFYCTTGKLVIAAGVTTAAVRTVQVAVSR